MKVFSLNELSNMDFMIRNIDVRAPLYKEHATHHLSKEPFRRCTGIMYVSNSDISITSLITNNQYIFKKGTLVLLPQYSNYYATFSNIEKSDYSFICANMYLYTYGLEELIIETDPTLIFEKTPDCIVEFMKSMLNEKQSSTLKMSEVYMLWHLIFENICSESKTDISHDIASINISNKSNKELAEQLNISVSTLTRFFKKYYNSTPAAHALKLKLNGAKHRLKYTDMSIAQIAESLGQ